MRAEPRKRSIVALLACAALVTCSACAVGGAADAPTIAEAHVEFWPPRLGQVYPDVRLTDQTGRPVSLSRFRGKVILIEPIGMGCPACQAFSGANRAGIGPFAGGSAQPGLRSIEEYLAELEGGPSRDDPRLIVVQLLLYDTSSAAAPTAEDARRWAEHFGLERKRNRIVLAGDPSLVGPASHAMVPGFQLIDRDFVLRVDSTGHAPRHDLWTELLPELARLVRQTPVDEGSRVGQRMPSFELPDASGRTKSLDELRGGRPALLYFYSGCCGHCSEQLPGVAVLAAAYEGRNEAVIGVEYFGNETTCVRNRGKYELPGTILADGRGEVCGKMGVGDFTLFTLDQDGVIAYRGPLAELPPA